MISCKMSGFPQDLNEILKHRGQSDVQNDSQRQNGYFVYSTCPVVVKRNIDCSLRKGRMVLKYQSAGLLRLRLAMTGDVPSPLAADFR